MQVNEKQNEHQAKERKITTSRTKQPARTQKITTTIIIVQQLQPVQHISGPHQPSLLSFLSLSFLFFPFSLAFTCVSLICFSFLFFSSLLLFSFSSLLFSFLLVFPPFLFFPSAPLFPCLPFFSTLQQF